MFVKKVVIILIILLFFGLVAGGCYFFAQNVREDQQLTKEKMEEISGDYDKFNKNIELFVQKREELYKLLEESYLENFAENYQNWNTLIADYGKLISDVEDSSESLKDSCFIKFADIEINNKCTNFVANYEAAMNYYITDIKNYNTNIVSKYNEWAKANGKEAQLLEEGKLTVHKKYIDFDKDKEYTGKEDINEEKEKNEEAN